MYCSTDDKNVVPSIFDLLDVLLTGNYATIFGENLVLLNDSFLFSFLRKEISKLLIENHERFMIKTASPFFLL